MIFYFIYNNYITKGKKSNPLKKKKKKKDLSGFYEGGNDESRSDEFAKDWETELYGSFEWIQLNPDDSFHRFFEIASIEKRIGRVKLFPLLFL